MLTTLTRQAYFSYRALNGWANWPSFVGNALIAPGFLLIMISLTGRFARDEAAAQSYVAGMSIVGANFMMMGSYLQMFTTDRNYGTLGYLLVSRGSRLLAYVARPLPHIPVGLIAIASSLAAAAFVLGSDFTGTNWPVLALAYLLTCCSAMALGMLLSTFCLFLRDYAVLTSITQAVLYINAGVVIPRNELPPILEEVGKYFPLTNGLAAVRGAFAGESFSAVAPDLGLEFLVALLFATSGYFLFLRFERYAIRTGEYDMT